MPSVTCGAAIKTCVAFALLTSALGVATSAILTAPSQTSSSQCASTSAGASSASGAASTSASAGSSANSAVDNFDLTVAGTYSGHGSATVSGGSVQISVPITDGQGNAGTFAATITIVNGHFSGTATAMGSAVTLVGRVDASDAATAQNPVLRVSRLVGTFTTAAGLHGRLAGQWTSQGQPPATGGNGGDGGGGNNGNGYGGNDGNGNGGNNDNGGNGH